MVFKYSPTFNFHWNLRHNYSDTLWKKTPMIEDYIAASGFSKKSQAEKAKFPSLGYIQ